MWLKCDGTFHSTFKLLVLIILLMLLISGCWDVTEIDHRDTVIALGLDAAPDNKVLVSAQIPLLETSPMALGAAQTPEKPFHTITSISKTSNGGILGLESKAPKKLYLGQLQSVVVNTALAERGLREYCGVLERHPELSPQAVMALTETTSQDILSVSLSSKFLPGLAIHDFLEAPIKADEVYPIRIWQFVKAIEVKPVDAYLPIISYSQEEQVYKFEGLGVFHRDRLVGKLSDNEGRMAGIIMGRSDAATLIVPVSKGKIGEISYRRVASQSKISILRTSPNLEFLIKVNAKGFAPELTSDKTNLSAKDIKKIERATAQSLKKDMLESLQHLQKLNSDIIGFGDILRGSIPVTWKHLNWDEEYPRANFKISVKFNLESVGEYR